MSSKKSSIICTFIRLKDISKREKEKDRQTEIMCNGQMWQETN